MLSRDELLREAAEVRFQPEPLEKVHRLLDLLAAIRTHPFLKTRVVLKGGTALNLFLSDVPRLSVDIDLNYIGSADCAGMLEERPRLDESLQAICGRLGIAVKRIPGDHAGGKWRLSYTSALGRPATLEVDMNYMIRTPLWPPVILASRPFGSHESVGFPMVDLHELAAGKLCALLSRQASRDVFDARTILADQSLDDARLRLAFVVYGGMNRKDWRTVAVTDVVMTPKEVEQKLLPLLRLDRLPLRREIEAWTDRLVAECQRRLDIVLPLQEHEIEFLTRLNDSGEIGSELLTADRKLQEIIRVHPMLLWKAQNVRSHRSKS